MLTDGEGIGGPVGLNFANEAVLVRLGRAGADRPDRSFASYRHIWSPRYVDNDLSSSGWRPTGRPRAFGATLTWTPALDLGAELMFVERELESGASGEMTRLQIFAEYGF